MTSPASAPLLQVRDLSTWFHAGRIVARAVDGVSFDVMPHETVGLVGESGCGKSVTSLSILRLIERPGRIEPGSRIEFEGRDLLTLDDHAIRDIRGNRISMIFQEPMTSLNPVFTVGDQVAEVARVHSGASRREAWDRAVDMLQQVGVPAPAERAREYPHQLSGGLRQRAMIAMALMMHPALLIADEPTTALDVTIQAQILELLAELQERVGMSILLITHDLGVIAESASRVLVMYAGQIVEQAPNGNPRHRAVAHRVAVRMPVSRSMCLRLGPLPRRGAAIVPDRQRSRVAVPPRGGAESPAGATRGRGRRSGDRHV